MPKEEEIPKSRPYEEIVFYDFFNAGLFLPCDPFVRKVLIWFWVQIHEPTLNAISRISVFGMSMKMQGLESNAKVFTKYY